MIMRETHPSWSIWYFLSNLTYLYLNILLRLMQRKKRNKDIEQLVLDLTDVNKYILARKKEKQNPKLK